MLKKEIAMKDKALLKKALLEVEAQMKQHNIEGFKFLRHLNQLHKRQVHK